VGVSVRSLEDQTTASGRSLSNEAEALIREARRLRRRRRAMRLSAVVVAGAVGFSYWNVGFEARQELVSLRDRKTKILWTEPKSAADHRIQ
jgi:hypothetical protein